MPEAGNHTAGEIEPQVTDLAKPILHAVAENVKKQHVPQQVFPTAMEELVGDELVKARRFGVEQPVAKPLRLAGPAQANLENKDQDVDRD